MKKILTIIVLCAAGCGVFNGEPAGLPPSALPELKPLPPKLLLPNREYDLLYMKQRIAERQIVIPKDKEFCNEKA